MNRGLVVAVAVVLLAGGLALAQRRPGGFGGGRNAPGQDVHQIIPNIPYDGRFMFVRLRYGPPTEVATQRMMWTHDYPVGEQHFMKIMNELTYLNPHTDETNIIGIGDPELFKYPVAYLCEPGFAFDMSDDDVSNLRDYLHKGGFLIVDDFRWQDWSYFETQIKRVLPDAQFKDLDVTNPIFHSFFEIKSLDIPQYYDPPPAVFRAIYEDNDPKKRIMVMINYNTDISEYWEWSDTGLKPIDESNEAYKIGVNYIVYGMTH